MEAEASTVQCVLVSGYFDAAFYREQNPELPGADGALAVHFCTTGWRQFRDPCASFSVLWYLAVVQGDPPASDPLTHFLMTGKARGGTAFPPAFPLTVRQRSSISRWVEESLPALKDDALACTKLACSAARFGLWHSAVLALDCAKQCASLKASDYELLATANERCQQWQPAVDAWQDALRARPNDVCYLERLGDAYAQLGRVQESLLCYKKILSEDERHWQLAYKVGCLLEEGGGASASKSHEHYYALACSFEPSGDAMRYGVGVLHEANGAWEAAARAYLRTIEILSDPRAHAEIFYRLGMVRAKCHEWSAAQKAFEQALTYALPNDAWLYVRGITQERLGLFAEAADSYARALQMNPERLDLLHRQAVSLARCKRWEEACALWASMPPPVQESKEPECEVDYWAYRAFTEAVRRECLGEWNQAIEHYEHALARRSEHSPCWNHRLGMACIQAGRLQEACAAFSGMMLLARPTLFAPAKLTPEMEYVEFVSTLEVQPKVILYDSYAGRSASCSPYALFIALLRDERFKNYLHVWAVHEVSETLREIAEGRNVNFVKYGSSLHRRYLAQAGYLIGNLSFPSFFSRRPEQRYLNTWHGTPLKNLGKGVKGSFLAYKNTARDFLQATHLISPNRHTTELLYERYGVDKFLTATVTETGYPRIDTMLNAGEPEKNRIRERLGLSGRLPVVLYAPTWRGAVNDFNVNLDLIVEALNALAGTSCHLLFRGHYFIEKLLIEKNLPVEIVSSEIDTCGLLAVVDVLVTDYSSIFFDYIAKPRPVIYYIPDVESYVSVQGELCLPWEALPGQCCKSQEQLKGALTRALSSRHEVENDPCYQIARQRFCPYEDGRAAQRTLEFLFEDNNLVPLTFGANARIMVYAGDFYEPDIDHTLLSTIRKHYGDDKAYLLAVDPWEIDGYTERQCSLKRHSAGYELYARVGHMPVGVDEAPVVEDFLAGRAVKSEPRRRLLRDAFSREYRRLFGACRFDVMIDLSGRSPFWAGVLAFGALSGCRVFRLASGQNENALQDYVRDCFIREQVPIIGNLGELLDAK